MKCYISNQNKQFELKHLELKESINPEFGLIKVYPFETKQVIYGIGGAFTEAAAYTLSKMSRDKQDEIVEAYFGNTGNLYNYCRTHIQSCDFSLGNNAYINDKMDKELKTFSLEQDEKLKIPFMKKALEKNANIQILASPWSPPAFMKTNGEMNNGGKLKKEYYTMWADMIAKFVSEYKKMGIPITMLTIQNEPQAKQTWDSCLFTGEEERIFACDYLKKALVDTDNSEIKINIWDHNKDQIIERVNEVLANEKAEKIVDGIAFHWYTGDHFEALQAVRDKYPQKELIFTEGCVEYSRFAEKDKVQKAEMYAHDMIGNFNAGMNGFMDWNLLLDEKGGPNHVSNFCEAPIMCDISKNEIDYKLSFYYIGHFSRFVKVGAKRILTSRYTDQIEVVGFLNPDGEKVLVVLNKTNQDHKFKICEEKKTCDVQIEAHSIMTICW